MSERSLRERIAEQGRSLFDRGLASGSSGNISIRLPDGVLITPTNSCLGRLDPDRISKVSWEGEPLAGAPPSKEAFLHLAMYRVRPHEEAIVHLHSTYSVAVSCLAKVDPQNALPPLTAYYVMRVGHLPLIPYYPPGDLSLAQAVERAASQTRAVLLANHGPVVAAKSLDAAVSAMEELEETAKLFLLLQGQPVRCLDESQIQHLRERYPT